MKRIYSIEDACIGCHLCEVACITEHSRSKDPVRAFLHEAVRPISRCTVEEWEGGVVSLSTNCRHCDEPDCLRAYGAVQRNLTAKKANKCDLCPDRENPACVDACPNRALVYKEGSQK